MHAGQRSEAGWMKFAREYLLWGFPKPLASWEMLVQVDSVEMRADLDVLHHGTSGGHEQEAVARCDLCVLDQEGMGNSNGKLTA